MTVRCCSRPLLLTLLGGAASVGQSGGQLVAETCRPAQGQRHQPRKRDEHDQYDCKPVHASLPSMDGCAIIDARRRESTEPGPLWRANATTTGNVQTGAWKSRLHSGNTEQDMRNALVKSFMCDHYSKTMHWAATDRDPARYGIRGRSEYWLHRPSPTLQHRERAFFLLVAEKERKSNGIRPSHHLPQRT